MRGVCNLDLSLGLTGVQPAGRVLWVRLAEVPSLPKIVPLFACGP